MQLTAGEASAFERALGSLGFVREEMKRILDRERAADHSGYWTAIIQEWYDELGPCLFDMGSLAMNARGYEDKEDDGDAEAWDIEDA